MIQFRSSRYHKWWTFQSFIMFVMLLTTLEGNNKYGCKTFKDVLCDTISIHEIPNCVMPRAYKIYELWKLTTPTHWILHFCWVISALPVNNILHAMLRTTSNIIFMVNDKTSLLFLNSIVILVYVAKWTFLNIRINSYLMIQLLFKLLHRLMHCVFFAFFFTKSDNEIQHHFERKFSFIQFVFYEV